MRLLGLPPLDDVMRYWFLAYQIVGPRLPTGEVSNVALAGIHPLDWISQTRERAPTATAMGMTTRALFYDEIDADLFARIERENYIPTQRDESQVDHDNPLVDRIATVLRADVAISDLTQGRIFTGPCPSEQSDDTAPGSSRHCGLDGDA